MLRLVHLTANQRWVFTFGDALLRMEGEQMFYPSREAAVAAAADHGLGVTRLGIVYSLPKEPDA